MTEYHEVKTEAIHPLSIEGKHITPESRYWFACHKDQCSTLLAGDKVVCVFGIGFDQRFGGGTVTMIVSDDIEKHGMALFRCAKKMVPTLERFPELWAMVDCKDERAMRFAERFGFTADHVIYRRKAHGAT